MKLCMPPREWRHRVDGILDAISRIDRYTSGMTLEQFQTNDLVMDAVRHNIYVIAEAASNLPTDIQDLAPTVPWSRMRGMRNRVAHEYWGINLTLLWGIIEHELGPLVPILRNLLDTSVDVVVEEESDGRVL
jgi:uncharacterized protein with HEPN domain